VLFNEPKLLKSYAVSTSTASPSRFSALQRAEIAEIALPNRLRALHQRVSVLFNEPKLLKSPTSPICAASAATFQCSSTSRNC